MISIGKRLSPASVKRMHGMTHFVYYGKYILKCVGIVQKDIRLAVIRTEAVGTAGFALVFVNINPAFLSAAVNLCQIFIAERCKSLLHHFQRFFVWYISFRKLHKRNIDIVHFKFIYTENFLAKGDIPVENRKIFMYN